MKLKRIFLNSSIYLKLGFLSLSLRWHLEIFPNSQRDFGIFESCSILLYLSQFFPIQGTDVKLTFMNVSLDCTSQFTAKLGNWDFWSPLGFIFCQIERILFQAKYVCMRDKHFKILKIVSNSSHKNLICPEVQAWILAK